VQQAKNEGSHVVFEEEHEPLLLDWVAGRGPSGILSSLHPQPCGKLVGLRVRDEIEETLEEREVHVEHALRHLSSEQTIHVIGEVVADICWASGRQRGQR
jgi:hypothetical protein